jgi:hypothetical protein
MHCEHTERLLDAYLAALGAFYDAHKPTMKRWLRRDKNRSAKEVSRCQLREASVDYWIQVEVYEAVAGEITRRGDLLAV